MTRFSVAAALLLVFQLCSAFALSDGSGARTLLDDKKGHSSHGSHIKVHGDGHYKVCAGHDCVHNDHYGKCYDPHKHCPKPKECKKAFCDDYYKCKEKNEPDGTKCSKDYLPGECWDGHCRTCDVKKCPDPGECKKAICNDWAKCDSMNKPDGTKCYDYNKPGECWDGECRTCDVKDCPKPGPCKEAFCNDWAKCDTKNKPDGTKCYYHHKWGKCHYGECKYHYYYDKY